MNSSGFWDQSGITNSNNSFPSQHEVQLQRELSQDEIRESILLSTSADQNLHHNHLIHAIDDENCSIGTDHNQLYGIDEDENDDFLENSSRMRRSGISIDDEVYEEDEGGENENEYRRDDEEEEEEDENDEDQIIEDQSHRSSNHTNTDSHPQPSLEQIQRVYYLKGLQELESLQLFDLSPLANWKLSSWKQGFGLKQLRDDSPDTYWQSDGSNSGNSHNNGDNNANQQQQQQQQNPNNSMLLNHLSTPHSITIQFSKKVALERISIFTNYSLDESYTPSKIKIMAGSSEGWDLIEVCTVNFDQPIGWSHIIFNGIRNDGVLKCFLIKIIILANHQEGKDSHIRAIRCFGKKSSASTHSKTNLHPDMNQGGIFAINNNDSMHHSDLLKDLSLATAGVGSSNMSGFSLNNRIVSGISDRGNILSEHLHEEQEQEDKDEAGLDFDTAKPDNEDSAKISNNVSNVIGFNTGFQSLELKSISSIR